ncbi:MscS Mechanosensitive ion channel [Psychromonas ingrahamii 37]|uniref:MscS Mechanosensitive ion channel n=2 Tax=Psychromonas ingrahamii TaxID=357794 RepID=A1SUV5_PSYIN|nr:mechanosensitive ion channel domain-containing protein [Psychromonas ingrahamii]ABM03270.1 MscS Mechanosensitive ion channel [Psychromonas ingrahamii 37]
MKNISQLLLFLSVIFFSALGSAQSQDSVTIDLLDKRIEQAKKSQEYDSETQAKLIQLYRDSISHLHQTEQHKEATAEYQKTLLTAPQEINTLKKKQQERLTTDPLASLKINQYTDLATLEKLISDEEKNRSASEETLSAINTTIGESTLRPSRDRERINYIRLEMAELDEKQIDKQSNNSPAFTEADNWYQETKRQSLQTELLMLDQELTGNSTLLNLLQEKQKNEITLLKKIEIRIAFLHEKLFNKRAESTQKVSETANLVLNGALAEDNYLQGIAKQNLALIAVLELQFQELQTLLEKETSERKLSLQVSEAFHSARKKLQLQSDSSFIALSIRAQREKLPKSQTYIKSRSVVLDDIANISLRLFRHEEMLINDEQAPGQYDKKKSSEHHKILSELLENRQNMLERVIKNDRVQQSGLYELDARYLQLINKTKEYDDYLTEHLLWLKSSNAFDFIMFTQLPSDLKCYVSHFKSELLKLKKIRLPNLLLLFIPLSLVFLLIFLRQNLLTSLQICGEKVGSVKQDSILHTLKALIYTTLLALPAGLILFIISWAIKLPTTASNISVELANAGIYTAVSLFAVQLLKVLCIEKGVSEVHFGRKAKALSKYVKQLNLFIYFGIPCYFITLSAIKLFPATLGGALAVLGYSGLMFTLVRIIYSIFHPHKGLLYPATTDPESTFHTRKIIFFFTMCLPVAIVIMSLAGYTYTAGIFGERLYFSILFAAVVWIFHSLLSRWLLITSKRLTYDNLVIARKVKWDRLKATESEIPELIHEEILEHEANLKTLDGDSHKLINAATLVLAVVGFVGVWGQMLPALSFLEQIELWNKDVIVDGKEVLLAVRLDEVLVAFLVSLGGYILSRNLPSLIDIILLKNGKVSPGSRYAIVTLTRYGIVIITILITMSFLGINSSRIGWMFAALSVGIGFGLQEVVANFICGLILLFERPIRVGDIISTGSTDESSGTVIRIRIRATTIRNFDEKELLIPNKELITGRVLNWTLSDEITRIMVKVGIAYGSDVELAMTIIEDIAKENEHTLTEPPPFVNFEEFADSSLLLTLRAYVATQGDRLQTITELHKEIYKRFKAAEIMIPFPQQDVHLISQDKEKS